MEKKGDGADAEPQFDADFVPDPSQVTLNIYICFFTEETQVWV